MKKINETTKKTLEEIINLEILPMLKETYDNCKEIRDAYQMIRFMYQIGRYNTLTLFLQMYDCLSKEQKEMFIEEIQKTESGNMKVIKIGG